MLRIIVVLAAAVLVFAGLAHAIAAWNNEQAVRRAYAHVEIKPPLPSPTPWLSYAAQDYRRAGHPSLTTAQVSAIQRVLGRVKPCQRRFVRYTFTNSKSGQDVFAMFFGPYAGGLSPHALGKTNEYYSPVDGNTFPVPGSSVDYSLKADIEKLGCPAGDVIPD